MKVSGFSEPENRAERRAETDVALNDGVTYREPFQTCLQRQRAERQGESPFEWVDCLCPPFVAILAVTIVN